MKIDNINKYKNNILYLLIGFIIYLASAFTYRTLYYPGSNLAPVLLTAVVVIFVLFRPIIGLAVYMVFYPLVPASGEVNLLKMGMLLLTVIILAIWAYQRLKTRGLITIIMEYRFVYLFFGYLLFSIILTGVYGYSITDWARDIASLLNLLLIPVFIDYLKDRKNYWLLYLVFVPVAMGMVQNILLLLAMYGAPFADMIYLVPFRVSIFHPSWIFGLGAILYLQKAPPNRSIWFLFAVAGLLVTILTPGRTIWVTTIIITGLIIFFLSKYRKQALALIATAMVVMTVIITGGMGSSFNQKQAYRINQFIEYQRDLSVQNRVYEAEQALQLFYSSPLCGVGFGFQYHFWRFITGKGYGYMDTNYTHNDLINIIAKGGLIGLLLFLLMIYSFYNKLHKRRELGTNPLVYAWATVAVIILSSSMITGLSTPIFQTRSVMFGLFFILSLGLGFTPKDAE